MKNNRKYQIMDVVRCSGVSVRTLRHYHDIGLLVPASRTEAGYRLYNDTNLLRLQQILIRRALGLSLGEIRRALDEPAFDARVALMVQRIQFEDRAQTTARMIAAIDRALAVLDAERTGKVMTADKADMTRIFDGFDPAQYEAEAEQRWGMTDSYKEASRRAKRYTTADWEKLKAEQAGIYQVALQAMVAGATPDDPMAMAVADAHRRFVHRWFYPCDPVLHQGLADMWEADPRFAESIDKYGAGLTPFLAAAVRANAARYAK